MSDIDAQFAKGLTFVENSKNVKLSTETKLRFYGLYKASTGTPGPAPSKLKIVEYKKWSAWKKITDEGVTKERAKQQYVDELNKAVPNWQDAKL